MSYLHLFYFLALAFNFWSKPPVEKAVADEKKEVRIHSTGEDDKTIAWAPTRRLSWDDFLCEPDRSSDAVASTSTSLGIAYQLENGGLTYSITCNFSKHKSWGLLKTDYILAHEQGHFDITEVFARILYSRLNQYQFNRKTFRKDVNEIYQQVVKEKEDMQAAYDGESDHSRNRRMQHQWLQKIEDMLAETAPFDTYP